ncbi:Cdg1 cysteine dioxygenase [Scheffersomyces xylosifermentans]|uniref:Cdg1 cysteine dioxygenase n=1 Tax=Scheffersomyces xylosifermentans TaxID=1304137 RepID=UPI00315D8DE5
MLTLTSSNHFDRPSTPTQRSTVSSANSAGGSSSCGSIHMNSPNTTTNNRNASIAAHNANGVNVDTTTIDCIPKDNDFYKLIMQLKSLLGPDKGLSSEDVDIEQVRALMESYTSNDLDWLKLALHDPSRNYSRNGIINLNGNANLLILVWSPGKSSAIHDHAKAHCCMKILSGELMESLYEFPHGEGSKLKCKKETLLQRDVVGYISDNIGLHKISNPSNDKIAVSLHLYTPPYAALYGCSMYEASNGRRHHVDMSKYYSWQGQLVNPKEGSTC